MTEEMPQGRSRWRAEALLRHATLKHPQGIVGVLLGLPYGPAHLVICHIQPDIRLNPGAIRGPRDPSCHREICPAATDRAATPAYVHHARHHGDRRLRLAEGRQMAGS